MRPKYRAQELNRVQLPSEHILFVDDHYIAQYYICKTIDRFGRNVRAVDWKRALQESVQSEGLLWIKFFFLIGEKKMWYVW